MQTIVPYLAYEDAPAALDFLRDAFGFTESFRMAMDEFAESKGAQHEEQTV